jgi:hypothetical protein
VEMRCGEVYQLVAVFFLIIRLSQRKKIKS